MPGTHTQPQRSPPLRIIVYFNLINSIQILRFVVTSPGGRRGGPLRRQIRAESLLGCRHSEFIGGCGLIREKVGGNGQREEGTGCLYKAAEGVCNLLLLVEVARPLRAKPWRLGASGQHAPSPWPRSLDSSSPLAFEGIVVRQSQRQPSRGGGISISFGHSASPRRMGGHRGIWPGRGRRMTAGRQG